MNVYNIGQDVYRFCLYNLNYAKDCETDIEAHYTFWYHKPSNTYVMCQHGDWGNLVSFRPVHEMPRFPSAREQEVLKELIQKSISRAYFWNYDAPRFHMGRYLLDDLETRCEKCDGWGTESFKMADGIHYDFVMKTNAIFDNDTPSLDYKLDREYWDEQKARDNAALSLFRFSLIKA